MNERNHSPLAVALHYNGNGAPRVIAKGGGQVAERIIETAYMEIGRASCRERV